MFDIIIDPHLTFGGLDNGNNYNYHDSDRRVIINAGLLLYSCFSLLSVPNIIRRTGWRRAIKIDQIRQRFVIRFDATKNGHNIPPYHHNNSS